MTNLSPSLNQPKSKEKEGFKGGESEIELAVPLRQRNRKGGELETGPGKRPRNLGNATRGWKFKWPTVSLDSMEDDAGSPDAQHEDEDPYDTHLSGSFVPSTTQ